MTVTLTQVYFEHNQVLLFGQQVSDFYLRGDLGLGMDPAGPLGFAWIQAYQADGSGRRPLARPLLMTVHGAGEGGDPAGASDERCWRVDRHDLAVRMIPSRRSWAEWLELPDPAAG